MIKIISFDVGGTLTERTESIFEGILHEATYFKNEIKDILYTSNIYTAKEEQKLLTFLSSQQLDCIKKHYIQKKQIEILPHMLKLLKNLSENYKIIISSNRNCLSQNYVDFSEIENIIDAFFYSNEIGIVKNNPDFFIYCANKLHVSTSEILHIGDNIDADFNSPLKAKCSAILWNNNKLCESIEDLLNKLEHLHT